MQRKTKRNWFLISTVIAVVSFWLPSFARSMYQKGAIPESITVTIVMLSMPVAFLAAILAVSFLISLFFKQKE